MKYWNKSKEVRQRCWTQVILEQKRTKTILPSGAIAWFPKFRADAEIKQWCQRQKSTGKFYSDSDSWWFELPQDATWFTLKWT